MLAGLHKHRGVTRAVLLRAASVGRLEISDNGTPEKNKSWSLRGRFISRSSVLLAFFWRLIDVLLAFFSRLMNVAFSVLFSFLLTFYLHSANRMPIEHKIDILLAFGLILSLIDIFCLIE